MTSLEILQRINLRVTPVRTRVLDTLIEHAEALSPKDIENALEHLDRITLYRTIKTFEEKGVIHKAHDGTQVLKYALCVAGCSEHKHHDKHIHFRCEDCDKTFCVDDLKIPSINIPSGYLVKETQITLTGLCQKCNIVA